MNYFSLIQNNENYKMPVWALIIVIILSIIGFFLACWGVFSAFGIRNKKNWKLKKINNDSDFFYIINNAKFINLKKINNDSGVFFMQFGQINENDFILPIFIFESKNIKNDVNLYLNELKMNKTEFAIKVNQYIEFNKIDFKQISFAKLPFSLLSQIYNDPTINNRIFRK